MPRKKATSSPSKCKKAAVPPVDVDGTETDDPTTTSNTPSHEEGSDAHRDPIRRQVVQEFLEACGDDPNKRKVIRELAKKVLGSHDVPLNGEVRDSDTRSGSGDDDSSDSSEDTNKYKWADVNAMDEIDDSPYEIGASAEVGLDVFDEVKALLEPQDAESSRRIQPTERAIELMGLEVAYSMTMTSLNISQSGMVYSSSWLDGKIRDHDIRGLKKSMLLMCLQDHRFSRAESSVLSKLVEDLQITNIIREALDDWDIDKEYPKLSKCNETPFPYKKSHKTQCQKCEIFVARAYASMNILKRYSIENDTASKAMQCLRIMEENIEFELKDKHISTAGYPLQVHVPRAAAKSAAAVDDDESNRKDSTSGREPRRDGSPLHGVFSPRKKLRSADKIVSPQSGNGERKTAVEQLDLETGQVLACFESVREANIFLDRQPHASGINMVMSGNRKATAGYFWRKVGTDILPEGVEPTKPTLKKPNLREKPSSVMDVDKTENEKKDDVSARIGSPHGRALPVEKLDPKTGKVLGWYPSIGAANIDLGMDPKYSGIRTAIKGGRKSVVNGYFFRKAGSVDLPEGVMVPNSKTLSKSKDTGTSDATSGDNIEEPVSISRSETNDFLVEKLDPITGKVLGSYASIKEANSSLGRKKAASGIGEVLSGRQKTTGGYVWRKVVQHLPGQYLEPLPGEAASKTSANAASDIDRNPAEQLQTREHDDPSLVNYSSVSVEKVSLQEGNVLASYGSIKEANFAIGRTAFHPGIWQVLTDKINSSGGYFWRTVGSTKLPQGTESAPTRVESVSNDRSNISCPGGEGTHTFEDPRRIAAAHSSSYRQTVPSEAEAPGQDYLKNKRRHSEGSNTVEGVSFKKPRVVSSKPAGEDHSATELTNEFCSKVPYETLRGVLAAPYADAPAVLDKDKGRGSLRTILAMNEIVESPYQEHATAEVGEEIFDIFKAMVIPMATEKRRQSVASDLAIKVFGESLAQAVIEASTRIGIAGILYNREWSEGIIRTALPGPIPKPILLLLLHEQRFSRPGVIDVLTSVVLDFDLCNVMKRALKEWNLVDRFWKLSQVTTHTSFTSRKSQCYRCMIFIARAFHCMRFLKVKGVPDSIKRKVDACLHLLEANIGQRVRTQSGSVDHTAQKAMQQTMRQKFTASDDEGSVGETAVAQGPPKAITSNSHILFQQLGATMVTNKEPPTTGLAYKIRSSLSTDSGSDDHDAPGQRRVATKMAPKAPFPPLTRQSSVMSAPTGKTPLAGAASRPSESDESVEWFPHDAKEVILTAIETETAWLLEECIYCYSKKDIDWNFVYKYASPNLKVELRRQSDGSPRQLHNIVRMHDKIVDSRFTMLRKEIRRKLHHGSFRSRMKDKIPQLRLKIREKEKESVAI